MILQSFVALYAMMIYYDGTRSFQTIKAGYEEPVKKLAGEEYSELTILNALNKGYISQKEYDETMAYKEAAAAQPQA
ncbi:putative chaperone [Bacillus phage vB_BcM_Sam112]|uniref:Putative chaperone n=1 Tax=Bacillus phage vB_BcM_Sam112 TaxID=2663324 RepID=A0A5Q2F9B4_9CAUD|nr:putative chaperone [Bacillus phage vB_BcM_Sam112]